MPELRIDPLSGLRVIVARERSERPGAWPAVAPRPRLDPATDPFAEGREDQTPPELFASRPGGGAADGPGWRVRVVPNLYPALTAEDAAPSGATEAASAGMPSGRAQPVPDPLGTGSGAVDLFAARPAEGAHEVIVNAPEAVDSLLDLGRDGLEQAMGVWRERMHVHGDAPCRHLIVNEGKQAGASLPHTHAQLYALPFVPAAVARERERFAAYHQRTQGRNLLEDLLVEEVRRGDRLVTVDSEAVAVCPFASAAPFQVQVIPRRPAARFEDDGPLGAGVLWDALERLERVLGALPPFNLWVRTAPSGAESFCWRIDLLPRMAQPAGLEIGTGVWLNAIAPERAAESLRTATGPRPASADDASPGAP
jgi:UDPglucose--hexose-1-phosphate uridylyltransferase